MFFFFLISSIQNIDGGFFEKFGSLLRQKSQTTEQIINSPRFGGEFVTDSVLHHTIEGGDLDSGTETLHDEDSEPEDQHTKQEEIIEACTGLNVSQDENRIANCVAFDEKWNIPNNRSKSNFSNTKISLSIPFSIVYRSTSAFLILSI